MKGPSLPYALVLLSLLANLPASADQFKLPEEIGRIEAPRDTNIFQVEPTVLNERYYTSGRDERHQFIGATLPEGAPIPDSDAPVKVAVTTQPQANSAPASAGKHEGNVAPQVMPGSAK